jgi:hypothetical protein
LILNIKKSNLLSALVLVTHLGALLILLVLPLPAGVKIGLSAIICVQFWWLSRHGALVAPGKFHLTEDGSMVLVGRNERAAHHYRVARATVYAGFVRLVLEGQNHRARTLLIMQDAVTPEVYRELRARVTQRRLPERDPESGGNSWV